MFVLRRYTVGKSDCFRYQVKHSHWKNIKSIFNIEIWNDFEERNLHCLKGTIHFSIASSRKGYVGTQRATVRLQVGATWKLLNAVKFEIEWVVCRLIEITIKGSKCSSDWWWLHCLDNEANLSLFRKRKSTIEAWTFQALHWPFVLLGMRPNITPIAITIIIELWTNSLGTGWSG